MPSHPTIDHVVGNPVGEKQPGQAMGGGAERLPLASLLTLFSPAFPIGAFAWSHGLEAAIAEDRLVAEPVVGPEVEEARAEKAASARPRSPSAPTPDIADGPVLQPSDGSLRRTPRADASDAVTAWVETLLDRGSGWNDGVLLVEAFHAAAAGDRTRFDDAADLAEALAGSAERRAETLALGTAFAEAAMPWMGDAGNQGMGLADTSERAAFAPLAYPVAVGRLAVEAGLPLAETLLAFAHGFAASLVSAAVRLVPLAQSDAVHVMHRLEPVIAAFAERVARSKLDDLGSAAIGSDIAAMRHETLSTRLFRS